MSKLSELMHREIWSKSTSKYLLFGFVGCLVCLGIYGLWVTPMERRAAIEALKELQALRQTQEADDATYSAQLAVTQEAVEKCKAKQFTLQDKYLQWATLEELQEIQDVRLFEQKPKDFMKFAGDKPEDAERRAQQMITKMRSSEMLSEDWLEKLLGIKKN